MHTQGLLFKWFVLFTCSLSVFNRNLLFFGIHSPLKKLYFFGQCTANHCSTHQSLVWGWIIIYYGKSFFVWYFHRYYSMLRRILNKSSWTISKEILKTCFWSLSSFFTIRQHDDAALMMIKIRKLKIKFFPKIVNFRMDPSSSQHYTLRQNYTTTIIF